MSAQEKDKKVTFKDEVAEQPQMIDDLKAYKEAQRRKFENRVSTVEAERRRKEEAEKKRKNDELNARIAERKQRQLEEKQKRDEEKARQKQQEDMARRSFVKDMNVQYQPEDEHLFAFGRHAALPRSPRDVNKEASSTMKGIGAQEIQEEIIVDDFDEVERQAYGRQSEADMSQNLTVYKKSTSLMEFEDLEDKIHTSNQPNRKKDDIVVDLGASVATELTEIIYKGRPGDDSILQEEQRWQEEHQRQSFEQKHPQLSQNYFASISDHRKSMTNNDSKSPTKIPGQRQPRKGMAWEIDDSIASSAKPVEPLRQSHQVKGAVWELDKSTVKQLGKIQGEVMNFDAKQQKGFERGFNYAQSQGHYYEPSPPSLIAMHAGHEAGEDQPPANIHQIINRKEQFIVELEMKSKLNQIQRKEKTKQQIEQEERMRVQQEILGKFLRRGVSKEDQYEEMHKSKEKSTAEWNKMMAEKKHNQEVEVEVVDVEKEYNERLMRISQNFEDSIAPKTELNHGDATSFNTSINDRDSYAISESLGESVKQFNVLKPDNNTHTNISNPYTKHSQDKFSGGLSRLDVRDDLTSNFKNSTFDRDMTMTSGVKSQLQKTQKISPRPTSGVSPRGSANNRPLSGVNANKQQPVVRPMTATTQSDMFDRDTDKEGEEFHKSLIKTIDHNVKSVNLPGRQKRKLTLQDKQGSVYTDQQLMQIEEQIERIHGQRALPDETRGDLVKSLSFNLSQESRHQFESALRQSYKDVNSTLEMTRQGIQPVIPKGGLSPRTNNETVDLNYSMTESNVDSRRNTFAGQSSTVDPASQCLDQASQSTMKQPIEEQTMNSEQYIDSISHSQLPADLMAPQPKTSARKQADEQKLPNSAAGQARQFYYGANEESITVDSKDFDHAYDVSGNSQMLRALRQSKNDEIEISVEKSGDHEKMYQKHSFGNKDEKDAPIVGPDQQLIEDSSNSAMMNMAISLDPLSAQRALGNVNQQALQKQKAAMEPLVKDFIKPKPASKDNRDEKHIDTPQAPPEAERIGLGHHEPTTPNDGYSQDGFESDEDQAEKSMRKSMNVDQKQSIQRDNKMPVVEESVSKYAISMGQPIEDEDSLAMQGLLGQRFNQDGRDDQELKSTSKFYETQQEDKQDSFDKEFGSGDPDFDDAERQAYSVADNGPAQQKKRAQWGNGDSFGAHQNLPQASNRLEEQQKKLEQMQDELRQSKQEQQTEVKQQQEELKKQAVALDIGMDSDTLKGEKLKRFEEFKQKQAEKLARRQAEKERIEELSSPVENVKMPKFGKKQPSGTKKTNVKPRPGRKVDSDEEEKKGETGFPEDLNLKVSPGPLKNRRPRETSNPNRLAPDFNVDDVDGQHSGHSDEKIRSEFPAGVHQKFGQAKHSLPEKAKDGEVLSEEDDVQMNHANVDASVNASQPKLTPRRQGSARGKSPSGAKQMKGRQSEKKGYGPKSNKKIIKNSLLQVALPGQLMEAERDKVYKQLEETDYANYIILFKGTLGGKAYRALYGHNLEGDVIKICGAPKAPPVIKKKMVDQYYKFNVGSKDFANMYCRDFETFTDGVSLKKDYQNAQ